MSTVDAKTRTKVRRRLTSPIRSIELSSVVAWARMVEGAMARTAVKKRVGSISKRVLSWSLAKREAAKVEVEEVKLTSS